MAPKKILIITGDFVEDYEIMVPYQALLMVGHQVDVVCPDKKAKETIATAVHDFEKEQTYTEKRGHNFTLTATFSSVKAKDYDALLIPGGRAPEYIRLDKRVRDLVREFDKDRKPIASICHGLQVLSAAGVVTGRKVTGYKAIGPDLTLAGANYVEVDPKEVVVDGNLVTSPAWPGHPKLLAEFLKLLGYVKFVSQLRQRVNDIDWFLNNISAKEEQENSDLAKQYQEIHKNSEINDTVEPSK